MPHIRVNDVRLYYEFHGPEDGDLVVLNNGIFMNTGSWLMQMPALERRHRVLAYDMRGQGQSEHPEGEYSFELHADDLAALMDALDLDRAHMVGTSYGGEVNLLMALRHPARCRSLVIITSLSHLEGMSTVIFERWRLAAELGDARLFFRLTLPDLYSEAFLESNPDLIPFAEERYATLDLASAVRLLKAFQRIGVTADLGRIQAPTCIASAEFDVLKPRRYGQIMHEGIPGSEFHLIPDSGHVAVLEKAAEVNTIILGFLAKQP
jgi:3-oxoadipate enol-lactonase